MGEESTAAGSGAYAEADYSTAVGSASSAFGEGSAAFGSGATAAGDNSVAVGLNSTAAAEGAVAVGGLGQAYDEYNFPILDEDGNPVKVATQAEFNGTAVGSGALATGDSASAFGSGAQALGGNSVASGIKARATGEWSTAIGSNAWASGGDATATGAYAWATANGATAFGTSAWATATNASAFGYGAWAAAGGATALGMDTWADGVSAVAIGRGALSTADYALAIGATTLADGTNAIALGRGSLSLADNAVAIGWRATVQDTGAGSLAVGANAFAQAGNSVALGAGSLADRDNTISVGASQSWTDDYGVTHEASQRQIANVAAGTEDADAVNLEQMREAVANVDASGNRYFAASPQNGAVGVGASADGENATAAGELAAAFGDGASALGARSTARGASSTALGSGATASAQDSVALGAGSLADRANTVSVGSAGGERQIANVAAGTEDTDAVNVSQLNSVSQDLADLSDSALVYDDDSKGAVTLAGENGTVIRNVAAGELSADSTDAVNGSQLFETNERVGAVEGRIGDIEGVAASAIVYDDADRSVATLGGESGTRLTNLADGAIAAGSTDAVAGGQVYAGLQSAADALGGGATVTAFGTLSAPSYAIQGTAYYDVGSALGALDAQISTLNQRVTNVEAAIDGGPGTHDRIAVGGTESAVIGEDTTAVAIGSGAQANSHNSIAHGNGAYAHGPNDTAIGGNSRVHADGSTAVGANTLISADATNAVAVGEGASVTAASGTAIGQGASVTAEGAVALGQGSVADRANTVSVGSAGNERQIANVAAGTAGTDAANVAQVQAGVAESKTYTDTTATQTLSSANSYTDQKFATWNDNFESFRGDVERRFHDVDRRLDRQGAMSAAMLNMATSAAGVRTQNRVGVGVGFQSGESALSVGYQRAISERATVTIGGAFSGDEKSVGLGAGFGW
ncbi:YadA-like family protein [Luteimonas sp. Y-2-2-4F]|nr:YadA-like family protein [Luteimonas sp. Y-2-2-4F]